MNSAARWLMPSIDEHRGFGCFQTLSPDIQLRTVIVPNWAPHENLGVPASWNIGVRMVLDDPKAEWLVLLSEAMRFGQRGGEDFEDQLDGMITDALFGWHLIGFHRTVFETIGLFDEIFSPGYWEDTDLLWRMHCAGLPSPRENDLPGRVQISDIDAHDLGTEHSLKSGLVKVSLSAQAEKYRAKWGGPQGSERWTTPYGK